MESKSTTPPPDELAKAIQKLDEAGLEEERNGIRLQDGTVVGTVEDNKKVKKAFGRAVREALAAGNFKIVDLGTGETKEPGKTE